jgi:hypothetical protein
MNTSGTAKQLPPLDIGRTLRELFGEVRNGTAHLNAAKSLAKASESHPIIMRVSPLFFTLTTRAHLYAAQLCAARLFDTHDDCAGIWWLLKQAKQRPGEFNHRTTSKRDETIREIEQTCNDKQSVLAAIKCRRDRWLTHLDKRTIRAPINLRVIPN